MIELSRRRREKIKLTDDLGTHILGLFICEGRCQATGDDIDKHLER